MAEAISKTILQYELDKQSADQAKQGIASIGDVTDSLTAKQNRLSIEADQSAKELVELRGKMRGLDGKEFDQAALRAARLEEKLASVNDQITDMGRVRGLADDFDDISRNVSSAGDVQSNLGALRGLAGTAGLGGVAGGLDVAGEVTVLIEELPRLASSMSGLSAAAQAAFAVIGASGFGLVAGLAALAVVLGEVNKQAEETRARIESEIQAAQAFNRLRLTSTLDDVTENLDRLQTELQGAAGDVDVAEKALRAIFTQLTGLDGAQLGIAEIQVLLSNLGIEFGEFGAATGAANDALDAAKENQATLRQEFDLWNVLLNDSQVATNTLNEQREEENRLIEERNNNVNLQLLRDEIAVAGLSAEQIQARVNALSAEQQAISAAIDAGRFTGDALEQQNARLGEIAATLSVFLGALPEAQEVQQLADAEEYRKKQIEESVVIVERANADIESITEGAEKRRVALIRKAEDDILKAAEKAAADAERVLAQLEQKRDQIGLEAGRGDRDAASAARLEDLNEQIAFQQTEAATRRDHLRNLERIQQSFDDREEDLIANRDFSGIRRNRRDALNALRDQNTSFSAEQKERIIAAKERAGDAKRQRIFEAEQRQIRFEDRIADAEAQATRDLALIDDQQQKTEAKLRASRDEQLKIVGDTAREETLIKFEAAKQQLEIANFTKNQLIAFERERQEALLAQARQFQAGFFGGGNTTNYNSFSQDNQFQGGGGVAQQQSLVDQIATKSAALVLKQLKVG